MPPTWSSRIKAGGAALAWDPTYTLNISVTDLLLGTARWSPFPRTFSHRSFVTALRRTCTHHDACGVGAEQAQVGPGGIGAGRQHLPTLVDGTDLDHTEFAEYDLGQSVADPMM